MSTDKQHSTSAKVVGYYLIIAGILFFFISLFLTSCVSDDGYKWEGLQSPTELSNCIIVRTEPLISNHTRISYLRLDDTTYHCCKMSDTFASKIAIGDTIK